MAKLDKHWHPESEPSRLIALSDGIFGVALTLAVIEIIPPELSHRLAVEGAGKVLIELGQTFYWAAMNFVLVSIYWVAHHRLFTYIRRADYALLMLNILFLMLIAFMPFAVKVVFASPIHDSVAVAFYAAYMGCTGLALNWIWSYATRGRRLVDADLDEKEIRYSHYRSHITVAVFFLSAGVAFINPIAARYCWMLLFFNRKLAVFLAGKKSGAALADGY